jgi:5-methylcytosine-specific restriction endonuclease McrA
VPTRLCLEPRCPQPATYRGYCAEHARTTNRATHRNRRVYNSKRWQLLRRAVLFDQPLCASKDCDVIATDVDHIVPIEQGGAIWDRQNLQPLCAQCHGRKTRAEQHG